MTRYIIATFIVFLFFNASYCYPAEITAYAERFKDSNNIDKGRLSIEIDLNDPGIGQMVFDRSYDDHMLLEGPLLNVGQNALTFSVEDDWDYFSATYLTVWSYIFMDYNGMPFAYYNGKVSRDFPEQANLVNLVSGDSICNNTTFSWIPAEGITDYRLEIEGPEFSLKVYLPSSRSSYKIFLPFQEGAPLTFRIKTEKTIEPFSGGPYDDFKEIYVHDNTYHFVITNVGCNTDGDINGDNKIGLEEAINALQIVTE